MMAETVMPSLENWKYWTRINDWDSRNAMMEELVGKLRRREATESQVALIIVICGPTWNGVAKALRRACAGFEYDVSTEVRQREEVSRVARLDRDVLDQLIVEAMLKALASRPAPLPRLFFPWLKETLAHRALDFIAEEVRGDEEIVALIDELLDGRPEVRLVSASFDSWLRTMNLAEMIDVSEDFASYIKTQSACKRAVERLAPGQRDVIEEHYFAERRLADIANTSGRSAS